MRIQDAWDFEQFKVLLQQGDTIAGISQNGVDIAIEGQLAIEDAATLLTEEEMLDSWSTLRQHLDLQPNDAFDLLLYHDDLSANYRGFRSCHTVRCDADFSNPHLYTYSLVIHAQQPQLQTIALT